MFSTRSQRTIAGPTAVAGFGYWSGRDVRVEFRPAAVSAGIVFVRGDLPGCPSVAARIENRVEVPRRSSLRAGGATFEMVEHILSALAGLEIDNCEVWVNEAEMPGCDGSCQPFVEALDRAGIVAQDAPRSPLAVREPVWLASGESWIQAMPSPSGRTVLEYHLDYGEGNAIGRQAYRLALDPRAFREELAPCRTFMLRQEAEWLLSQGIAQRATARDLLVFGEDGPIDNALRFPDECVRHKMMDMVGDLALAGCPLVGEFVAHRSGHRLNAELVKALIAQQAAPSTWKRCA